jgi:hypothetical protein
MNIVEKYKGAHDRSSKQALFYNLQMPYVFMWARGAFRVRIRCGGRRLRSWGMRRWWW